MDGIDVGLSSEYVVVAAYGSNMVMSVGTCKICKLNLVGRIC